MAEEDAAYLNRREREERERAQLSADPIAANLHRHLADAYRARLSAGQPPKPDR